MIVAFIDELRAYREWTRTNRPVADRTITAAQVINQVRHLAWTVDHQGMRRMAPEGLWFTTWLATVRRGLNQAVFQRIYIVDDEVIASDLTPTFQRLMSE